MVVLVVVVGSRMVLRIRFLRGLADRGFACHCNLFGGAFEGFLFVLSEVLFTLMRGNEGFERKW